MATDDDVRKVHDAIRVGDIETVRTMISSGTVDVNEFDGITSFLHRAATYNQIEIAKFLIENGIDINMLDHTGTSALINAVIKGNLEMVKLLCESGAELDSSDPDNNALFSAGSWHQEEIAQYLVDMGIDIYKTYHIGDMENCDAYIWADKWGAIEISAILDEKEIADKKLFEMTINGDEKEIFKHLEEYNISFVSYNSFDEIPEQNLNVLCGIDGKLYCGASARRFAIQDNLKGVSFSVVQ